ncbi:MAG: catechol 2,3-dioxygenase-like lactoylglutathione lyase family enzyme [Candidatus Promineifilaceae bacterium]|jgi:catechol 2,3-dioxygenase-like lactoylglutathione lyase family enzyme
MINITRLHHVSICVRDMEASRHFYVDILGMEEVKRPDTFQFPGQWFRKNGYEIHTISAEVSGQIPGDVENNIRAGRDITFARHFCFSVSGLNETIQTLHEHQIDIVAGPQPRGDGAVQIYIYDPDGHMVELVYEPK